MKSWPFPTSEDYGNTLTITQEASAEGIRFMHIMYGSSPCTVAYRPLNFTKNCKMMEVSVAYKHPRDQYVKKTGASIAAQRMLNGESIFMPLRGKNPYDTMLNIEKVFGGADYYA